MSAEDIEYMDDYKEFPTKESALDWLDNYLSLDERNNLIKALEQEPSGDLISRKAVLDGIEELKKSPWATDKRGNGFEYLIAEALDVVADLCVKQAPPVKPQEPKIGHWIENLCDSCTNKACEFQSGIQRSKCDFYIPPMPHLEPDNCGNYVVQQEQKIGHWIKSNIPNEKYVCSECGGACWYYDYQADVVKSRFCPNCGADMRGDDNGISD